MITTRNVALSVMALSVALSLSAAEQNVLTLEPLTPKYMTLVQHKINFNPCIIGVGNDKKSQLEAFAAAEKNCYAIKKSMWPLLIDAQITGLNQCYDSLLQGADKDAIIAKWAFTNNIHMIVCMQKEYGNGDAFTYNTKRVHLCPDPGIGEYVDQNNKPVIVTFYSFFFSLLNRLDSHIKDQKQVDENVRRSHKLLETALDEALTDVKVRAIITDDVKTEINRLVDALQTMLETADNNTLIRVITNAGSGLHQLVAQLSEHYVTK